MSHSQHSSQKLLLVFTLGAAAILITFICFIEFGPGSSERKLASLIDAPKEGSAEQIAVLCRRMGPSAIEKVFAESKSRDRSSRLELLEAVLRYDTCGQLERVIIECTEPDINGLSFLLQFLKGRMDTHCCTVLKRMVQESKGYRLQVCCNLLASLGDDPETLQIAKSLVLKGYKEHRSPEEMTSLIFLLSGASYCQDDTTAAVLIDSMYEGMKSRVSSVWFFGKNLSFMPGEFAESLLRRLAADFPDEISENTLNKMLVERKKLMAITVRRPGGWRTDD